MAIVDAVLEERLDRLNALLPAGTKARQLISEYIRGAPDRALFRINPHEFAAEVDLAPGEAVPLFLCGVRAGLFTMEWAMVCNGCGEIAQVSRELDRLEKHFDCRACDARRSTNLDRCVQVHFTVAPQVRSLAFHEPESLELEDYFFARQFSRTILLKGTETKLVDFLSQHRRVLTTLPPRGAQTFDVDLEVGWLVGSPRAMVTVSEDAAPITGELELTFNGLSWEPRPMIGPGRVRLRLQNDTDEAVPTLLYHTPEVTYFEYLPFLSGRDVLNTPAFRRHLHTQVVRPGTGLPMGDNTILFVDFVGSTAKYGEVGDEGAFELVSRHLDSLGRLVTRAGGTVVKTMGDAVMAAFSQPSSAVVTALQIPAELGELDCARFATRVGIHRGSCIAVNVGETVDYFGNTVNIAARLEHCADTDQICVSAAVAEDPRAAALLGDLGEPEEVDLKGVDGPVTIYRIRVR